MYIYQTEKDIFETESSACADQEGGTGGPDPPEKSQKYRVTYQYWFGSP